jgi:hypothetical protein
VLTIGAINAYISGAAAIAGQLAPAVPGSRRPAPTLWLLAAVAAAGLLLITAYGLRVVAAADLVAVPTALFLSVYLGAMAAAARLLRGPARLAALPAALAVTVMLGFCGWALAIPAAAAVAAAWRPARRTAIHGSVLGPDFRRSPSVSPALMTSSMIRPGSAASAPDSRARSLPRCAMPTALRSPGLGPCIGRGQPGERTIDHGPLTRALFAGNANAGAVGPLSSAPRHAAAPRCAAKLLIIWQSP